MQLEPIIVSEKKLTENFNYWKGKWNPLKQPPDQLKQLVNKTFPTHTFPYQKSILDENQIVKERVKPYKAIFSAFNPEGLLSDGFRTKSRHYKKGEAARTMNEARKFGLNNYVFAYLGIHEAYYGPDIKFCVDPPDLRPFGVFIKEDVETFPNCLPTRQDVNQFKGLTRESFLRELIHPTQTRDLTALKVMNEVIHNEDFWHYYGSPEFLLQEEESEYRENAWKRKVEYHYFERLTIENIKAVLWPIWYQDVKPGKIKGEYDYEWSDTYYDLEKFRIQYPSLHVIPYELDDGDNAASFIEASYYTIRYYLEKSIFPINAEEAKRKFL